MAKTVVKRDGSRAPFESNKISKVISTAAKEAGLSPDDAQAAANRVMEVVLQYVNDKDEIFTDELKNLILDELDEFSPEVSRSWREYDRENKGIVPDTL